MNVIIPTISCVKDYGFQAYRSVSNRPVLSESVCLKSHRAIRTSSHIVKSKAQIQTHPPVPRVLNPDPPKLFGIWWTLKLISVLVFSVKYKQRCENVVINFSIQPTTMYVWKYGFTNTKPNPPRNGGTSHHVCIFFNRFTSRSNTNHSPACLSISICFKF